MFLATAATPLRPGDGNADVLREYPGSGSLPMNRLFLALCAAVLLVATLSGCADTAFQSYVQNRAAAIASMPNGPAKYKAQEQLDQQILAEKQRQHQQAVNAATNFALGMAAAAAGGASSSGGHSSECCPTSDDALQQQIEVDEQRSKINYLQEQLDDITNRHPGL